MQLTFRTPQGKVITLQNIPEDATVLVIKLKLVETGSVGQLQDFCLEIKDHEVADTEVLKKYIPRRYGCVLDLYENFQMVIGIKSLKDSNQIPKIDNHELLNIFSFLTKKPSPVINDYFQLLPSVLLDKTKKYINPEFFLTATIYILGPKKITGNGQTGIIHDTLLNFYESNFEAAQKDGWTGGRIASHQISYETVRGARIGIRLYDKTSANYHDYLTYLNFSQPNVFIIQCDLDDDFFIHKVGEFISQTRALLHKPGKIFALVGIHLIENDSAARNKEKLTTYAKFHGIPHYFLESENIDQVKEILNDVVDRLINRIIADKKLIETILMPVESKRTSEAQNVPNPSLRLHQI